MSPPENDDRRPVRGSGGHVEAGQADAASVAELQAFAVEHVARVCARSPQFAQVDEAAFVAIVISHLTPLPADRPWLHRRWQVRRGEAVWVGGRVGLHPTAQRQRDA